MISSSTYAEVCSMKLIILFLCMLLSSQRALTYNNTVTQRSTILHKEGILSRRIRALIFPKKAAILLTAALTKIVVGGRPSGLQYSNEINLYMPLPEDLDGWRPHIAKLKSKSVIKPKHRWDNYNNPPQFNYIKARPSNTSKNYAGFEDIRNHLSAPQKWQIIQSSKNNNKGSGLDNQHENYKSMLHVPKWKLQRGYQDRRAIYDQFETLGQIFEIDLKSCIKRAICEFKQLFDEQPKRGFLVEDIMRIVLTVPDKIEDEKYIDQSRSEDCASFYAHTCPYNVLNILTANLNKI